MTANIVELKNQIGNAPWGIHVVGRIESFLDYPEQLLPVSCTVGVLEDIVVGKSGLSGITRFTSQGLRYGAGVSIHVSKFKTYQKYDFKWRAYIDPSHPDARYFPQADSDPISESAIVLKVADTMEYYSGQEDGTYSIEDSWGAFIQLAVSDSNKEIVVDLSSLRADGIDNGNGLVASGPRSFFYIYKALAEFLSEPCLENLCQIFSEQNRILRRGGIFKNGAITLHFDYDQPGAIDFVSLSRDKTPWARLSLNIDDGFLSLPTSTLETFYKFISRGDVFVVKKVFRNGERLYHNVCLEILLRPFATCLLSHVNMGLVPDERLVEVFTAGMEWLCKLHAVTGVSQKSEFYLTPEEDRQVGLGLLGFANGLAIRGIKYKEFNDGLELLLYKKNVLSLEEIKKWNPDFDAQQLAYSMPRNVESLVSNMYEAYQQSAEVAKAYGMERAFTVAPTANCSFSARDSEGYTTAPEVAPPTSLVVDRDSETGSVLFDVQYHPDSEIAVQVGYKEYCRTNCLIQALMDSTGLSHAMSSNWWSDQTLMDSTEIQRFLESRQLSMYYAQPVEPFTQDKTTAGSTASCDPNPKQYCAACAE